MGFLHVMLQSTENSTVNVYKMQNIKSLLLLLLRPQINILRVI